MARKKIMFGIGFGIISLAADGISGVLILRLLTKFLPASTAGYWVLVTSAGSFLLLLQFGMGPTIARSLAHLRVSNETSAVQSVLGAIEAVFRLLSIGLCAGAIIIFLAYLLPAAKRGGVEFGTALSWFPYALGMMANLQAQSRLFILDGYGEVGWDRVFRTFYSIIGISSVWVALYFKMNLPALGLIYLILNVAFLVAAEQKVRSFLGATYEPKAPQPGQVSKLFKDGSKLLLLNLLTFLITQFTIFMVEPRFGIKQVTSYTAMIRVGTLIASVGGIIPMMLYPYVASAWAAKDYRKCRRYYLFGITASVGIFLAMSVPVFLFAKPLFELWLGPGQYPGNGIFGVTLLFYLVYVHHNAHATPALAVLGNAFAVAAVINTIMVLVLIYYLPLKMGLIGIPLGMLFGTLPVSVYVICKSWNILMKHSLGIKDDCQPATSENEPAPFNKTAA